MPVEALKETKLDRLFDNVVWGKRILLDIDGVICEYDFPKIVKNFFGVDLSLKMIFAYDLADVLGVAPTLINTMFREQVYGEPNFIEGALDTINEWIERGYDITIFSNRVKYMGKHKLMVWLRENKIPFHGINENGSGSYQYHIDDSPGKLASTSSETRILFNQPWNERCYDIKHLFIRVKNWNEIKEIVR